MLPQVNPNSVAFRFGAEGARSGQPFAPECWFVNRQQQIEFALGFESVKGVSEITVAFTGSELPKPVAAPKRSGWSEFNATRALKLEEAHSRRIAAMVEKTAQETPEFAGDILWAVA